ncbi:MAG: Rieske 2Fe-2S domain-containing protein [Rhodospirillaceae bacterium]|nr:Rieske 2Fe-2S domain-containing protein [Rhodospirillaceae bacterium]
MSETPHRVASLSELQTKGRILIKHGDKQVALFHGPKGVYACNNRCPHEGYPLSQGTLVEGCVLTCNWHNWKFDLESGETMVGGDTLRRYPVTLDGDDVILDLSDPPGEARIAAALEEIREAMDKEEYDRMARLVARIERAGGDPLDALREAVRIGHDRMEFGMTHAFAAAPDWLRLREARAQNDAERLVALLEPVAHIGFDTMREPSFPFSEEIRPYDAAALVAAIEAEDEDRAVALLRGGLAAGLGFAAFEEPLTRAALAHYGAFGHSLIYVAKAGELIQRLGTEAQEPVLLALVRMIVYARREDLIPEFRSYGDALRAWDSEGTAPTTYRDYVGKSVRQVLNRALGSSADPAALYDALLGANCWNMLYFDLPLQDRVAGAIADNVSWLDFTHGLTFANAVRVQCTKFPELWPAGLLQMGCFVGRNAGFVDGGQDVSRWRVSDGTAFLERQQRALLDHAQPEHIVSCHLVKVLTALADELAAARPDAPWRSDALAAVNRFLHTPLKRKHAARTARQALDLVAAE